MLFEEKQVGEGRTHRYTWYRLWCWGRESILVWVERSGGIEGDQHRNGGGVRKE